MLFLDVRTSSSAVAERSRNASCLSVVSFNSAIARAQSFIVTSASNLPNVQLNSVLFVFGVTLRLLVINVSSSSPVINKLRRLLPAISVTTCGPVIQRRSVDNTWPVAALTARDEARYWSEIAIFAYPTCIQRPH